jgi:hypothetical protein
MAVGASVKIRHNGVSPARVSKQFGMHIPVSRSRLNGDESINEL